MLLEFVDKVTKFCINNRKELVKLALLVTEGSDRNRQNSFKKQRRV